MLGDFRTLLWLLKLGAVLNLYLAVNLIGLEPSEPHAVVPALILVSVSAFRCLFPNRYLDHIVFHDNVLSSIFLTRLLATFSEVAYIYQFSHVIRVLNIDQTGWVNALSWLMVAQVAISQVFVWGAILSKRLDLYYYEELGWLVIFIANTAASGFLYSTAGTPPHGILLLQLNLIFGAGYLPWQVIHLRSLRAEAREGTVHVGRVRTFWREGLHDAIHSRTPKTDAKAWGGLIGLTWMMAYWASLIPIWVYQVAKVLSSDLR